MDFSNWHNKKSLSVHDKKTISSNYKYTFAYISKFQVGDHVTVELSAQRASKEEEKEAKKPEGTEETEIGDL